MRAPRLLVVGGTPPPYHGTSLFIRRLVDAREVADRFEVLHLETADRRGLENIGRLDPTNLRLGLAHVLRLAGVVRRERPDLVYLSISQNTWAYLRDSIFILIAKAGGARVITHLHGGYFGEFRRRSPAPLRGWIDLTQRWVHRAWVLGEGLRACYDGVLPAERVKVVPNGVPDLRELGGVAPLPERPPTLLFLGQLSAEKGILDLIEAAGRLAASGRRFQVVLAGAWGSEADRRAADRAIAAHGLSDRTSLPGVLTGSEKTRAFLSARAFVLPTRYPLEGQPLAVLEAMSAGLPVVATPRAAIPDLVRHDETGFLVPEGDRSELVAALGRLLDDAGLARRMGDAGRALYLERFTLERSLERVVELLEEALGGAPADAARVPPETGTGARASA